MSTPGNHQARSPAGTHTPFWVSIFVAITVLLAVLAAGRLAEHQHLDEKHTALARMSVGKMATDFDRHLDQLAQDASLLAELLWQTSQDPKCPPEIREKVLGDSVRVLSSAIHHCQGVAFSQDGKTIDVALDPGEDTTLAPWLKEQGRKAFAASDSDPRLVGPLMAPGGRPFFVQVQHLPFGVVVAAVDARRLFETLQHGRPPEARSVLVDADETLWIGCASFATCQAVTRGEWERNDNLRDFMAHRQQPESGHVIPVRLRRLLSLPPTTDFTVDWQPLETGGSPLELGLITSLFELQTYRRAERWRLLATLAALLLSAGIVIGFLWRQRQSERALHESLRHAEELNRLEHQLIRAEKLATVGALTAGLAHELGTPLAIIRGRAEILQERTQLPEIGAILDQSDRIASTLRQVLDFSREQPVVVQATDVVAAFRTVVNLLEFRFRQKEIRWRIEPGDRALFIAADPDQLQQVLVNLVMNACDACQEEGTITLRAWQDPTVPDFIRLDVADDGRGIPPDKLDAVFDPFFTTKPKGEGTGLGLPVAASIVRNHLGQIGITSIEGRGTTVSILWPADKGAGA